VNATIGGGLRRGVRLGVDVGSVRIGVARCDPDAVLASPLVTVARDGRDVAAIAALAAETGAVEVVVGHPVSLSGAAGTAAAAASAYAAELAAAVAPTPVRLVDERLTTVTAHTRLAAAGRDARARREIVDQEAAVIILQGALDAERATGRAPGTLVAASAEAGS
jgi:putative Holliday junction resolvase